MEEEHPQYDPPYQYKSIWKIDTHSKAWIGFNTEVIDEAIKVGMDWMTRPFLIYNQIRWRENNYHAPLEDKKSIEYFKRMFIGATEEDLNWAISELMCYNLIIPKIYMNTNGNKSYYLVSTVFSQSNYAPKEYPCLDK